jgi:hypothetical protein
MKSALQPAHRNLLAEPAYPNVSTCVQCASIDSAIKHLPHPSRLKSRPVIGLFVVSKRLKSFAIKQIHTLSQKTPVGVIMDIDLRMQNATAVTHLESTLAKVYQNKGL